MSGFIDGNLHSAWHQNVIRHFHLSISCDIGSRNRIAGSYRQCSSIPDICPRTLNDLFLLWQNWERFTEDQSADDDCSASHDAPPHALANVEANWHREIECLTSHVR